MTHMLRNWLTGISMKERSLIFVGAAAFYVSNDMVTGNDLIFEKNIYLIYIGYLRGSVLVAILVPDTA